jgi:SAM-dependent methyltransferase
MEEWLASPLGQYVLRWEQAQMDRVVSDLFGFHALQLGLGPLQGLRTNRMPHRWLSLDHTPTDGVDFVTDFRALPFAEQSLDLVLLPHTLEMHDHPHETLREVERVLVPEGRVVITGFNPVSLWGFKQSREGFYRRLGAKTDFIPLEGEMIGLRRLKDWLRLLGFEIEQGGFGLYKPALNSQSWLDKLAWLEFAGDRWWPIFGSAYYVVAVKRVKGMRILGAKWKKISAQSALSARPTAVSQQTHQKGVQSRSLES